MNNVDWNKVIHTLWHAALLIGAAYAAATPKYGWLTVALQALAQQTPPLGFTTGAPQFLKTAPPAVLLLLLFLLTGCFGNAAMVNAMKNNNATFCTKIITPWGGATYFQSNPKVGTATCDGMTITYGDVRPGQVEVPVTVVPQVTIGQPTVK